MITIIEVVCFLLYVVVMVAIQHDSGWLVMLKAMLGAAAMGGALMIGYRGYLNIAQVKGSVKVPTANDDNDSQRWMVAETRLKAGALETLADKGIVEMRVWREEGHAWIEVDCPCDEIDEDE